MPTKKTTNEFIATATSEQVAKLRAAYDLWIKAGEGLALDGFPMAKFTKESGLAYSRARQITRRWFIVEQRPDLVIDAKGMVAAWVEAHPDFMPAEHESAEGEALADLLRTLHGQKHSWGDLSGRTGLTESRCRALFEYKCTMRARGQRVGQGGAFLNADPTLYLENRKAEGAWVPASHKGPIKPEILLNFKKAPKVRAPRKPKAVKVEEQQVQVEAVA